MKHFALLAVVSTVLVGFNTLSARAADGNPPPPTLDTMQFLIPKHLRIQFASTIHPNYLLWLGGSNGAPDSMVAFQLYLTAQPLSRFDRLCFAQLYLELHAGG